MAVELLQNGLNADRFAERWNADISAIRCFNVSVLAITPPGGQYCHDHYTFRQRI